MSSKKKGLADLLHAGLKQQREGRRHAGKLYGRMAKLAPDPAQRDALEERHGALHSDADPIDTVFDALDKKPHDESCDVTEGHAAALKRLIDRFEGSPVFDAGLVVAAQSLERYAAGHLSGLRLWAGQLGLVDALPALDRMRADAVRAGEGFGALANRVAADGATAEPSRVGGAGLLTPKQAALIGLR